MSSLRIMQLRCPGDSGSFRAAETLSTVTYSACDLGLSPRATPAQQRGLVECEGGDGAVGTVFGYYVHSPTIPAKQGKGKKPRLYFRVDARIHRILFILYAGVDWSHWS